jgi:hypothetical protein
VTTSADAGSATEPNSCSISAASDAPLTDAIDVLSSGCAGERISIDDLLSALGARCFAGLLFLFAAPNVLPTPPGVDLVTAVPLALLSLQLVSGARRPGLPDFLLRREISTERFAMLGARLSPLTRRAEFLLTRRLDVLSGLVARRLIGLVCLALTVMLALPVPFGNAAPGAAISLFALGMMARDGIAVLAGLGATLVCVVIFAGFGYAAVETMRWMLHLLGG